MRPKKGTWLNVGVPAIVVVAAVLVWPKPGPPAESRSVDAETVAIKVNPLPSQTRQLQLLRSFPKETDEPGGVYFAQAQRLSSDLQGRIYVSDIKAGQIFIFGPAGDFLGKFGRRGQGPGEFNIPGRVLLKGDQLAVLDPGNTRIQYFSAEGRFVSSSRLAKNYVDMAIAKDGTIYGVTARKQPGDMIDALGTEGDTLFSFGRLPDALERGPGPFRSMLAMSPKDELFVAYWFAPIVQVYSAGGELRAVFEIQYKPMLEKLSRNPSGKQVMPGGGRPIGQSIIEAVYAGESGFFILHRDAQGRVDILEFQRDGTFMRDYWTRPSADYYPIGLVVRSDARQKTFYLLQMSPENKIDVFAER